MKQLSKQREEELKYISLLSKLNADKSREEKHLIVLSRDLAKGFQAINALGVEKAREFQLFYDFILNFEELRDKMKEFRWSKDFLSANGIDFVSYKKLYFSVC